MRPALAVGLVATLAVSCGSPASPPAAVLLPPPPRVIPLGDPLPVEPTDGLHRIVVRPEPVLEPFTTLDMGAVVAGGLLDAPAPTDLSMLASIDPAQLSQLPDDATLVISGDVLGYRDRDGNFVALDLTARPGPAESSVDAAPDTDTDTDTDTQSPPAEAPAGADESGGPPQAGAGFGHPAIDALSTNPDVVSIKAIGDGSFAVTARVSDVISGPDLLVTPDPLLAFTMEYYEPYQWSLDNTGDNLDLVQQSPPPQLADADIDGREAARGPRGRGVVVAVIDSGVDFTHPELAHARWTNDDEICGNGVDDDANGYVDDCHGWDFGYEDAQPYNQGNSNHGTHVAGIIAAAATNGIGIAGLAPSVEIMDLSVAGSMTTSSLARAIRYAVDNGADVINMSLGTSPGTPLSHVLPLLEAALYADANDVLLVVAAGNNGVDLGTTTVYPASLESPNVLTVGASSPDDSRASFSNYGSAVDVFAPGVLILSTLPASDYGFMSGTSQASPTTAAVAANYLEQNPDTRPADVITQLAGTGDEIAGLTRWGAGGIRLNGARAVDIDPDAGSGEMTVTIGGLGGSEAGAVHSQITLEPGEDQLQDFEWEATLVALRPDGVFGVVDHPLDVNGLVRTTDERGAVVLGGPATSFADVRMDLPDGNYGLVVEAVPAAEPSRRLGPAFATTFAVTGAPGEPVSTTTVPTGSVSTTTPGTNSTSSTTAGSGPTPTATPTTAGPGTTRPPTTASPTTGAPTRPPTTTSPTTGAPTRPPATTSPTTAAPTTAPPNTAPPTTAGASTTRASGGATGVGGGAAVTTTAPAPTTTSTTAAPVVTTRPPSGGTATTSPAVTPTTSGQQQPTTTTGGTTATSTAGGATSGGGAWRLYGISPQSAPVQSQSVISLTGSFPDLAYVWFGNQQGEVIYQSSTWILVVTPLASSPGPVELSLRTRGGGVQVAAPNAFTFVAASSGGGSTPPAASAPSPTTTTTAPSPGTTSGGGGTTTSTAAGSSTTRSASGSTTTAGPTPTTAPGTGAVTSTTTRPGTGPTTTAPASSSTTTGSGGASTTATTVGEVLAARPTVSGSAIDLGNGLRGVPLSGWPTLNGTPRCTSDPCRVRTL